jgi:hypothetical protein
MPPFIRIPELEERITTQWDFAIFLIKGTGKVTMDVRQKQRAGIEFLLLEGCEGDDTVLCLQNA